MKFAIIFILFGFANSLIFAQSACDTTGKAFYVFLNNPPKANLPDNIIEEKLNQTLNINLEGLKNVDYINVIYYVNCKGDDFGYKIAKIENGKTTIDSISEFSKRIIGFYKTTVDFSPGYLILTKDGKEEKKMVDYQGTYTIHLENGKFHILNIKEVKKHLKEK